MMWCKNWTQKEQIRDNLLTRFDRLTTYEEVRRSYPVAKIPDRLTSKEEIIDWWLDYYDREVGLLHKIKWHRIVLDG